MAFVPQSFSLNQVLTSSAMNQMDLNIDLVRISHRGTGTPASPVAGALWQDTNSAPEIWKAYDGSTFQLLTIAPAGIIVWFGSNSPPFGWLECDGSAVSRTTWEALFDEIGTVWGVGNGSTTFNIPDLRGEFVRGWDNGRGVDSGRSFATTQGASNASHNHSANTGFFVLTSPDNDEYENSGGAGNVGDGTDADTDAQGGEARPRNVSLLPCIKG